MRERRKLMRMQADLEAKYWAKGPSMSVGQATVRDFSRDGLGLKLPDSVEKGEHVDLVLRIPGGSTVLATTEVAWSRELRSEPGVEVGLRFLSVNPLDLARLSDFVCSRWLGGPGQGA